MVREMSSRLVYVPSRHWGERGRSMKWTASITRSKIRTCKC